MPEDQFGPKKPSISPYKYFEVACQTCGRQENQVIFSLKKCTCFLAHISHQEPYFLDILVSYESYDMWLCGKSEKKLILSGMGFFEGQFHPKITKKSGKSNFKAAEVIHMT